MSDERFISFFLSSSLLLGTLPFFSSPSLSFPSLPSTFLSSQKEGIAMNNRDDDLDEIISRCSSASLKAPSSVAPSSASKKRMTLGKKSPRTVKLSNRKDVSFIRDARKAEISNAIPPSLIPESEMMTEKSMFPPEDKSRKCWYDPEEKVYVSVIFPSQKPTGRHDVALLEEWLNRSLGEDEWKNNVNEDNRSQIVRDQVSFFSCWTYYMECKNVWRSHG